MKFFGFFLIAGLACAQEIKPDTVIGTVGGRPITAGEARQMIVGIRPEGQQILKTDPKRLLSDLYLLKFLAEQATKEGLHERSPLKEQIENMRVETLARAEVNEMRNLSNPTSDEAEKYYNDNKAKFEQAKVRVIYIAYAPESAAASSSGKKSLTEAQAKAKAEGLAKQLKAGADFGKLARENSDDADSAKNDGQFATMKRTDSYPPDVVSTVFALKAKEISEPLKQANGFYIFRVDERAMIPFPEIREKVFAELAQAKFDEKFKSWQKANEVKLDKPEALTGDPGPVAPPKPVK